MLPTKPGPSREKGMIPALAAAIASPTLTATLAAAALAAVRMAYVAHASPVMGAMLRDAFRVITRGRLREGEVRLRDEDAMLEPFKPTPLPVFHLRFSFLMGPRACACAERLRVRTPHDTLHGVYGQLDTE